MPTFGVVSPWKGGSELLGSCVLSDGCLCAEAMISAHWEEAAALISAALADLM